ncbi:hypothetical protein J7L60_06000 [Candidatus Bathyarchaeota archaeon]|nr:hypothetical protein [Candidatus Bathyarchaeota archaeon]
MKTLLCDFCLRSGMLCARCQEKVRSGAITPLYMEVGRFLVNLERKYPLLQDVTLHNVVQEGDILALVVGRGEKGKLQGYGGEVIRALRERFRKRVKVLEKGVSSRRFLEDLFSNMRVLTINTIWLPDGTTETKVVLRGRRSQRPSARRMRALTEIAKKVGNLNLRVEVI